MGNMAIAGILDISDHEFQLLSSLVYQHFGIHLTDQKKELVKGRLNKLVKELGFNTFKEYYHYVVEDKTGKALLHLVDKISTNHSYFFREIDHFDFLKNKIFPELRQKSAKKELRIWSAGCAEGEEVYTIAMVVKEFFSMDFNLWDIGLLATDISFSVLEEAKEGIYPPERLQQMPSYFKNKYFKILDSEHYEVKKEIKDMVLFKRLNLMNESFPFKGQFDIIFCRNVMIYFDSQTRQRLVQRFYNYTKEGGYLLIGHSESLIKEKCPYKYLKPAIYRKINETIPA